MKCFVATTQRHFYDQVRIRNTVFLLAQNVPIEEEIDTLDNDAIQFIVYDDDTPIGAARLRIVDNTGKVERVCVLKSYRKQGVGKLIMDTLEHYAESQHQTEQFILNAQLTAIPFYNALGYEEYGDIFLDANIEHRSMRKTIKR